MTLKELAHETGLTDTYLSFIERDKRKPSKKVLLNLSKALDLDFTELLAASMEFKDQNKREKVKKELDYFNELNEKIELHQQLAQTHLKLENFLKRNKNVYYKNNWLSDKNKEKILKLLDIIFEEFDETEGNYPTIEEFKIMLQEQKEQELEEEKRQFLWDQLEDGEITQEEFDNFDLDDIEIK